MEEDFRPIPVPENSVLSCGVQRDVVSSVGGNFQQPAGGFSRSLRGEACDDPGKQFAWEVPSQ